jgi:hypothetical protein
LIGLPLCQETLLLYMPKFGMRETSAFDFGTQGDQQHFDAQSLRRDTIVGEVLGVVEVKLLYWGHPPKAVRSENEIECFTDRTLSDIIPSN